MRKLFVISLASLILAACGGSDSTTAGSAGGFPVSGKWSVSGAMTGTLILAESGTEPGLNGASAATLYSGTLGSQSVTARQAFVSHFYDPHFTMQIGGAAADATLQDADHFSGTVNGTALKGVLEQ